MRRGGLRVRARPRGEAPSAPRSRRHRLAPPARGRDRCVRGGGRSLARSGYDGPLMSLDCDATTYDRLADPQEEWGRELLARLDLQGDERVLDAGCGSGRVTRLLA